MFLVDWQGQQHVEPILADVWGARLRSVVVTETEVSHVKPEQWERYWQNELRPRLLDDRCHIVIIGEKVTILT